MTHTPISIDPTLAQTSGHERGLGCLETPHGRLPLEALAVESRISGLEVATELRQTFVNTIGVAIEAIYIFPLPDRAAVHRFRMQVGERVVEGMIDERSRARDNYEQAIAAGQRAAIAEEDRPGTFTLRVGNLLPGDRAIVTLHLAGPLPSSDGEVTYVFPLVVAPRYIPGSPLAGEQAGTGIVADTDRVPDASRISPPVLLPGFPSPVRLSLRVHIDGAGLPISSLRSSLHEVDATPTSNGWNVAVRPGERLDRDFILRWTLGDATMQSAAIWAPDDDGEGATISVTVAPPVGSAAEARPRDVVLVLDRSGSMSGWKLVAARRAAARIVDTLGERDRFAVLSFDTETEAPPDLGPQLVPGSDRNRFLAVTYLATIASRGGTEMATPLELASHLLAGPAVRDRVLVLITDGQVGNEDEILRRITPHLKHVRVFTIGIDQAVNAAFLRRLSAIGGGTDELVESEARLDEVMARIHHRIATPRIVDVKIAAGGLDTSTQEPSRSATVFSGTPLILRARWRGLPRPGDTVTLRGRLPTGSEFTAQIDLVQAPPGAALAQAWARARIRDLEDRYAVGVEDKDALARAIVALSLRHRVLSRFTAFVAIDPAIVHAGGEPHMITQPVDSLSRAGVPQRGEPKIVGHIPLSGDSFATARRRKVVASGTRSPARSKVRPQREDADDLALPDIDPAPYVTRILALADDLVQAATTTDATTADATTADAITTAQSLVDRLDELLDELRSEALDSLADALAQIVKHLRAALTQPNLGPALTDAANSLRRSAERAGGPRPRRHGRAFWR